MVASGEEIGALNLPGKINYEDEEVSQPSIVSSAASPTVHHEDANFPNDMDSVRSQIRKLEQKLEQVDEKLDQLKNDVFDELSKLREFIDESLKSLVNAVNKRNELDESKVRIYIYIF